jgi:hypothetical protein
MHVEKARVTSREQKNKKKRENGTYVYICGKPLKNGIVCKNIDKRNGCRIHVCWDKKCILG